MTTTIFFTASVVKKGKGSYIARADQFAITSAEASTQRGAIKQLKYAVIIRLRKAAESGTLTNILDDAGYPTELIGLDNISLHPSTFNSDTVSVPVTPRLSTLNRSSRRARSDEWK